MRKYGFWKDLTFYFLIEAYADVILRAAGEVQEISEDPAKTTEKIQALADLRKEADESFSQFLRRLDQAFITPLDKEDLVEILQKLEMILAAMERAAHGLQFLAPQGTAHHQAALTGKLQEAAQSAFELASSLRHGHKHQALDTHLTALHRIDQQSLRLHDAALKDLGVSAPLTPPAAVTCKEAYDRLLGVPEACVELARLVARMLVKYA